MANSDSDSDFTVVKKEVAHKGKWLVTNLLCYTDDAGKTREWESVSRTTKLDSDTIDAVVIVPMLRRVLYQDMFVMVKQFRPPLNCFTLEFPAGLLDKDDVGPEAAALRELREETGYHGEVKGVFELLTSAVDPGLSESTLSFICVEIDGDGKDNLTHRQQLDDTESIDVVLFPVQNFSAKGLKEWCDKCKHKVIVDSRVHAYALGFQMSNLLNTEKRLPELLPN